MPISQIKIYGERNSGTNYLDSLIRLNYCCYKLKRLNPDFEKHQD